MKRGESLKKIKKKIYKLNVLYVLVLSSKNLLPDIPDEIKEKIFNYIYIDNNKTCDSIFPNDKNLFCNNWKGLKNMLYPLLSSIKLNPNLLMKRNLFNDFLDICFCNHKIMKKERLKSSVLNFINVTRNKLNEFYFTLLDETIFDKSSLLYEKSYGKLYNINNILIKKIKILYKTLFNYDISNKCSVKKCWNNQCKFKYNLDLCFTHLNQKFSKSK